jgi:diguanylate cyclase (GGDEF)-like protein
MAEKIRTKIKNLNIPHAFSQVADHITVSIGCKSMRYQSGTPRTHLLQKADQSLYQAKEQGRDRVVASDA